MKWTLKKNYHTFLPCHVFEIKKKEIKCSLLRKDIKPHCRLKGTVSRDFDPFFDQKLYLAPYKQAKIVWRNFSFS